MERIPPYISCQVYRRQDAKKADSSENDLTRSKKELSAGTYLYFELIEIVVKRDELFDESAGAFA